ncbi:hypothetical protein, partial [Roseateles koreensis]
PSRTPRNQYRLDIFLGVPTIGIHPKSPVFMRVGEVLQVRLLTGAENSNAQNAPAAPMTVNDFFMFMLLKWLI